MILKMLAFFAVASLGGWSWLMTALAIRRRKRRETERAEGVVADNAIKAYRTGRRVRVTRYRWVSTIEYTALGQRRESRYVNPGAEPRYRAGTPVEVLFDPNDPLRAHITDDPLFEDDEDRSIRGAVIWILAAAVLTVLLAVCVGGWRPFHPV